MRWSTRILMLTACMLAGGCVAFEPAQEGKKTSIAVAEAPEQFVRPVRSISRMRGARRVRVRPAARQIEQAGTTESDPMFVEGFAVQDLEAGDGPVVGPGSSVVVRLTGRLRDEAGSSEPAGDGEDAGPPPFQQLDEPRGPWPVASLIPGLAEGLEGMAAGGKRRVTIPPELGYGDAVVTDPATGATLVPAGATVVYEVEVVEVIDGVEPSDPQAPDAAEGTEPASDAAAADADDAEGSSPGTDAEADAEADADANAEPDREPQGAGDG